jgi:hypothetical protein
MRWGWPSKQTRENWDFVFKAVQALAILGAAFWALWTYTSNSIEQREAVRRELRKPYDEKQLNLYLEAARVVARLSLPNDEHRAENEARFWELYWGELPFVEDSKTREKIIAFCKIRFSNQSCGDNRNQKDTGQNTEAQASIDLSLTASCQIRKRWSIPRLIKLAPFDLQIRDDCPAD